MSLSWTLNFLYSQLFVRPGYPTHSFAGQVAIVTGSNTGLGLEAARHLVRLDAEKVILAVRNTSKGDVAKASIEQSTGRRGVVEVWNLDLSSYESVKQFANKAKTLERIDVLLENAGIMQKNFVITERDESTVTTNVVSTFLLALLMLPKLRGTTAKFNTLPRLSIVTSDLHFVVQFEEKSADRIFDALNDQERANMPDRYAVTKLLEIFAVRSMSDAISESSNSRVIVNCLTPGACKSDFFRETKGVSKIFMTIMQTMIARSTEVGSRTLVAAAAAGEETHGKYMADSCVSNESPFVLGAEGAATQRRVWQELSEKLEEIEPGILQNLN